MSGIKAGLLIFFVSVIVYSNSLGGEFIYDDGYFIVKNINIRNLENIPSFFINPAAVAFSELAKDVYRPVTTSSYALDYFLWKLNTFGYHLVNVLFHSFNAILLFLFLYAVFGKISFALFASLFFACHPVQTEVVSWISGRASVLFLFFYLAALLFYVKRYFVLSLFLYALSLFSKEMAVTLPLVLIACDAHFFPKDAFRKKVLRYCPYFALTLFFLVLRSFVLKRVSQCGWWGGSPYHTFLTMAWVMAEYIKLLFFPVKLCAFYVLDAARSIAETKVLASVTALAALSISLPYLFKRFRRASFAVWWFFITILPVSNIVPLRALMAERFLYLPSIGFCILIAVFIDRLKAVFTKRGRLVANAAAIALILAYSMRTVARNEDWKDPITVTERIVELYPLNPWALTTLATLYLEEKRCDEAVKAARKGIAISGNCAPPWHALGFCYLEM
ncbi:MAG: hypothetical protein Q8N91_00825, partial [Candidatus Omnitrophota bacterium]|nr:hypothetical protein [Candidatus Omnitrophota bacterium]